MALAGTGKWEQLGEILVRCAGPNLPKIQNGIEAGIVADNARSGNGQMAPAAKRGPGRAKKQPAVAAT